MIYCNYCGKESKGGILYVEGIYNICNECKTNTENPTNKNKESDNDE